jgi:putative MATE family efflux protein
MSSSSAADETGPIAPAAAPIEPPAGMVEEPDVETPSTPPISTLLDSSRPTWQRVLLLAWPVWAQQILLMTVGLYDQFLAGNNTPADPALHVPYQAAQTTANYLAWFISSCSSLVCVGSTALVARFVGADAKDRAVHAANQSILLAVVFGAAASIVGLFLVGDVVRLMGMTGPAEQMAVEFLRPLLALLVFQMIEAAGLACLVGAGDTRPTLWVLGGIAFVNMPLAWVCFHGLGPVPAIGFPGIALGTALSHTLGGIAVLLLLARGRSGIVLRLREMFPDPALIRRLLRISIPASIDVLSIGVCQLWFVAMVNRLGNVAAAAHGIAIRWESLGYLSGYPFATAAAALVGQNLGARRPHEAARSGWIAWSMGLGVMCVMGTVFFVLAPAMFELFCPDENQRPVVDIGVPVLRLVAFAMPPLACIIIFTGSLRGAGDTRLPLLLTWIGFLVIRIPLAYLLMYPHVDLGPAGVIHGADLGLFGAWLAMFADLLIRGALFLLRFATGGWKRINV